MLGLPLAFAAPAVLAALIGLVGLYFLLRVTPPSPRQATFPPLRLLIGLDPNETTPARTPWPILALRLAIGALIIFGDGRAPLEQLRGVLWLKTASGSSRRWICGRARLGQANGFRPGARDGGGAGGSDCWRPRFLARRPRDHPT